MKAAIACAAVCAAILLGSCTPHAGDPPKPLVLSLEEDPSSLDTILNTPYGWLLGPLTQGYLFLVDDRGRLVPDRALAVPTRANGGISADGRTVAYRIRTGRWSDGAPFDARDVAFTVAALRNPRTNVPDRSVVEHIASVEARGDRLVIRLRAPWAPFVSEFLTLGADDPFAILPAHAVAKLPDLNRSPLDRDPVSLGPFRLASWSRGERLQFERNPYYWRGPAASDRINVAIEPDASSRRFSLRTGEIDETYVSGLAAATAAADGARVARGVTNVIDYLAFNLGDPRLRDVRVRRAIARAIDRRRLAHAVYRDLEVPTDAADGGDGRLPPYDPAAARAVLAPLHLELDLAIAGTWRSSSAAALQIAADLARAGVTATIHSYAPGTFWGPKDAGGILESRRFALALTSWSPTLDPDRSYLFGCDALPPAGGNAGGYCDPAFDREEAIASAHDDPDVRARAYGVASAILARDVPVVPLGFEVSAYALSPRFTGFRPGVLGRDFWNAWEYAVASR